MAKPKVDVPPALMTTAELRALPLGPMRRSGARGAWSVPASVQPYRVGTPPLLFRRRLGAELWSFGLRADGTTLGAALLLAGLASTSFFCMVGILDGEDAAVRLASDVAFAALEAIEPR